MTSVTTINGRETNVTYGKYKEVTNGLIHDARFTLTSLLISDITKL